MKSRNLTIIELIAATCLLVFIVLALLNSAREREQIAAIKASLKNLIPQMELLHARNGNYSGINRDVDPILPDTACIGPIADTVQLIKSEGGFLRCHSINDASWKDVSKRWGATALIDTSAAPVKAWSVSPSGVVAWDARGVDSEGTSVRTDVVMDWDTAVAACATSGGRLPTIEELKTLADARCEALGNRSCFYGSVRNPPGFHAGYYWSGTESLDNHLTAHGVFLDQGNIYDYPKTYSNYVRCVR